jgi:hypothetical protein
MLERKIYNDCFSCWRADPRGARVSGKYEGAFGWNPIQTSKGEKHVEDWVALL